MAVCHVQEQSGLSPDCTPGKSPVRTLCPPVLVGAGPGETLRCWRERGAQDRPSDTNTWSWGARKSRACFQVAPTPGPASPALPSTPSFLRTPTPPLVATQLLIVPCGLNLEGQ